MDSSTYRHLLGQLSTNTGISHHSFPSHNLLSLDTLLEVSQDLNCDVLDHGPDFLTNFPCYQPFPYASQRSSVLFCGSGTIDHATELVKKKMIWEKKLKGLRVSNINLALKHVKEMRQNKSVKISNNLRTYIEHFHNDPEPMFSGNYNWLYTGGCLGIDEEIDGMTLITADFFAKQPRFNILKLNKSLTEIEHKSSCHLKGCSPVLQISCKPQKENLIICIRQKKYISLFSRQKMAAGSDPVKLWRKKVLGSKLITCIDVKDNCEEIIVTDSNHDMHIFHMDRKDKVYCHSGKRIAVDFDRDSWSQVAFGELGIYWAFRNCFAILDVRDYCSGTKLEYMPTSATNDCEKICSFVKSPKDSNHVYLGTTHSVLQVDLRMGKPVQRWTHLMTNPPQFTRTIKGEEKNEILLLQSQAVDEISGIVNESTDDGGNVNFVSKSLPCLLQSVKESLNQARLRGVCLSPFAEKRVNFAVTGILCLKNPHNDIILLTTNSAGDVFRSKIQKKTADGSVANEDEQEMLDALKAYESRCESLHEGNSGNVQLQVTDMSHLIKGFKKPAARTKKQKKREIYWKCHETYSPDSLKFFKDVLAQKILRVWGYGLEKSEPDYALMSVDSKVREWMNKFDQ